MSWGTRVVWLMVWIHAALADQQGGSQFYNPSKYYSRNDLTPRPWFAQFEHWYPHNRIHLVALATHNCNQTLHDYRVAFNAPRGSKKSKKNLAVCYQLEACIVSKIEPNHLLNYQSALVILGLVPAFMTYIGSSVAEISLLYANRPILAGLLSLGTPTLWTVSSLFEANTPDCARASKMRRVVPGELRRWKASVFSISEYLLAAGAGANNVITALDIGKKTVLSWGCTTQFAPFLWVLLPSVVFAIAGANSCFLMEKKDPKRSKVNKTVVQCIRLETDLCALRKDLNGLDRSTIPGLACLTDMLVGFMGFIHFCFGTAAFSSLQFVTVMDAFRMILCRFALSALICRLIVIMELAGTRDEYEKKAFELPRRKTL